MNSQPTGYTSGVPMETEVRYRRTHNTAHSIHTRTRATRAGGPLTPVLRSFLEDAFGCHLKHVRIHHDNEADGLNRQLGSMAFAQRENVFFRRGAFRPETSAGLWLLAHELAHVLQQRGSSSARVAPCRAAALEAEANVAASAVLQGRRVVVPPRRGCPSIQPYVADMHLVAVYWAGRTQSAPHKQALRVAIASESLDDSPLTAAAEMKTANLLSGPPRSLRNRFANNAHALGLTDGFAESEEVAREGIRQVDDLIFGLGLHTVGDFLSHANHSFLPTAGHTKDLMEDGCISLDIIDAMDLTYHNPSRALDTIARFMELWADFLRAPLFFFPRTQQLFQDFVLAPTVEDQVSPKQEAAFRASKAFLGITDAEENELKTVWAAPKKQRLEWWENDTYPFPKIGSTDRLHIGSTERINAFGVARKLWMKRENDTLHLSKADDTHLADGRWRNLGGGYPRVPIRCGPGTFIDPHGFINPNPAFVPFH